MTLLGLSARSLCPEGNAFPCCALGSRGDCPRDGGGMGGLNNFGSNVTYHMSNPVMATLSVRSHLSDHISRIIMSLKDEWVSREA